MMPVIGLSLNQSLAEPSTLNNVRGPEGIVSSLAFVLISTALVCLILATIIGNVFVITAILIERNLRTVGNFLILSLAITDFFVGSLVMPIGAIYQVYREWPFGIRMCEIFSFIDVLCSTASIFHLLAISADRFWAVTTVDYIRTSKNVIKTIALIWVAAAVISLGPMLGWKDEEFEIRIIEKKQCMVSQAMSYQVFATIFSFYAPCILLLFLYYRIYQVAKRLKIKQRYRYKIRRRPSFYRPRKSMESEIKSCELPCGSDPLAIHRSSLSSSAIQAASSSGVYSSSTTTTDNTTNTTTTGEYTSADNSPNSLNPLTIVIPNDSDSGVMSTGFYKTNVSSLSPTREYVGSSGKRRLSIQQFLAYQQQQQSELCERYVLESHQDHKLNEGATNELKKTATKMNPIIVPVSQSNIIVYVDEELAPSVLSTCVSDPLVNDKECLQSTKNDELSDSNEKMNENKNEKEEEKDEAISMDTESNVHITIPAKQAQSNNEPTSEYLNTQTTTFDSIEKEGTQSNNQDKSIDANIHNNKADTNKARHQRIGTKKKDKHKKRLQFRSKITQYDSKESKQESKAAKTLTIITGIFIICWLPFFLLALVMPLCKQCVIDRYLFDFCLWLGWANSTVNPFLYTIFSPDFRNSFNKLIFGHRRSKN